MGRASEWRAMGSEARIILSVQARSILEADRLLLAQMTAEQITRWRANGFRITCTERYVHYAGTPLVSAHKARPTQMTFDLSGEACGR